MCVIHLLLITCPLWVFGAATSDERFSMALRDVTNTCGSYIPQIRLPGKYAPLIRRGKSLDSQASRSSFPLRRARRETIIDLWVDGRMYPIDPGTKEPPSFKSLKE